MEPQKTAPAPDEPPPPPLLLTEGEFIKQYIAAKDAGQAALLAFAAKIGKRTIQDWDCKYYAPIASTAKKGIKVVLGNDPSVIVWCFLHAERRHFRPSTYRVRHFAKVCGNPVNRSRRAAFQQVQVPAHGD